MHGDQKIGPTHPEVLQLWHPTFTFQPGSTLVSKPHTKKGYKVSQCETRVRFPHALGEVLSVSLIGHGSRGSASSEKQTELSNLCFPVSLELLPSGKVRGFRCPENGVNQKVQAPPQECRPSPEE